jgi:transposase
MVCTKLLVHTMSEQDTQAKRRRRDHSPALKRELIERSLQPGASVSGIALDSGINANLLFKWRREHLRATRDAVTPTPTAKPVLLPVTIESPMPEVTAAPTPPPPCASRAEPGSIEIDIGGARVRLRGVVDESSVRVVLRALRGLVE